ncbi:MAG: chorismate-binding protein [Bacteroidota bacterium]
MNETLIRQRFNQAAAHKLNFAAVRLPNSNDLHFLYSNEQPKLLKVEMLTEGAPQFVCSPYSAGNLGYILNADTYYVNEKCIRGAALDQIAESHNFSFQHNASNFFADQSFYETYVQQGITAIQKNKLDKVVAARCIAVPLSKSFDAAHFFEQLTQAYPHACVYFFYLHELGSWCGATPEKLLTVEKGILQTVALAGTLPIDSAADWSDKEHDEQNMTEFFIEESFRELKLTGFRKTEVETIEAGAIKHLVSTISWKPKPDILKQKFSKLLGALNPTPAVCGLPQFESSIFISKNEQLERRFYSGFIGLLKPNETHLYVNLRCMQLGNDKALLYAGAGITEDSIPSAEWEETQRKMETLGVKLSDA